LNGWILTFQLRRKASTFAHHYCFTPGHVTKTT